MTEFENKIGYEFKNTEILERALTHSSYANEKGTGKDNERLEFLGDSVLGFITAEYLFENFKNEPEGELTKKRAYAVCESTLFDYAKKIDGSATAKKLQAEETVRQFCPTLLKRSLPQFTLTAELKAQKNSYCPLLPAQRKQITNLRITKVCFRRFYSKIRTKSLNMSL